MEIHCISRLFGIKYSKLSSSVGSTEEHVGNVSNFEFDSLSLVPFLSKFTVDASGDIILQHLILVTLNLPSLICTPFCPSKVRRINSRPPIKTFTLQRHCKNNTGGFGVLYHRGAQVPEALLYGNHFCVPCVSCRIVT